jgi:hypothetical protein
LIRAVETAGRMRGQRATGAALDAGGDADDRRAGDAEQVQQRGEGVDLRGR